MNDDLLIQRHLDGTLAPEDYAGLNQRLREDGELRALLMDIAGQAVAMGDLARCRAVDGQSRQTEPRRTRGMASGLALAASVGLLATGAWLWFDGRDVPILTLIDASGSVSWSHGDDMRLNVGNGETLSEGTIETFGEASGAQFQFNDGTLITLCGESEVSFSADRQKILVLRKGSFSAQVKPQPPGRPMIVRTPSAEAEIVGTTFHIETRPEDTLLKVDEGLVKLKRLADGTTIDVPARSSAVASLDSALRLNPAVTPEPLTNWRFDFQDQVPPRVWRGVWVQTPDGGRINASPYVAQKTGDGAIITHFGVSIRPAFLNPPLAVLATERSVVRYRLKQERAASLQVMLLTSTSQGGFGGNFECKLSSEELKPDAAGWCHVEIPIARFKSIDKRPHVRQRHPTPAGNIVNSFLISSFRNDTGLTVEKFELDTLP